MTSIGTSIGTTATRNDAAELVGRSGMALFGKKNPKWYPCVVKMDNKDGTIKVQWDDGKKFTKRLPVENFRPNAVEDPHDEDDDVPFAVDVLFGKKDDGDY